MQTLDSCRSPPETSSQGGESQVLLTMEGSEVKLTTRRQALEQVRAVVRRHVPEGVSDLAEELLAEWRREAAQEDAS